MRRFSLAIGVGVGIEVVLLLFGLHASLWFAEITTGHPRVYWVLNGLYFVAGIALGLVVVRWASARLRVITAALVLLVGTGIGLLSGFR